MRNTLGRPLSGVNLESGGMVPQAAWCRGCKDYVWVVAGECSSGHPSTELGAIYEAPPTSGPFVPPPPPRPDGRVRRDVTRVRYPRASRFGSAAGLSAVIAAVSLLLWAYSSVGPHTGGAPKTQAGVLIGQPTPKPIEGSLDLQNVKLVSAQDGRTYLTGSVANNSDSNWSRVAVEVSLFDSAGTQLGTESVSVPGLPPGESGSFEVEIRQTDFVRYEVQARASAVQ